MTAASEVITAGATRMSEDLLILSEIAVHPIFEEIEFLISLFEVEILNVFAYINGVTNMFQILLTLESEIRTYGALFEYFVSEVYVEMIIHGLLNDEINQEVFPALDAGLVAFQTSGEAIRSSLTSCN